MAASNVDVAAYVHEIASAFGAPWQATSARIPGTVATLVSPDGMWASVSSESGGSAERLVFEGWLPDEPNYHQPHGSARPIARASVARKPAAVAAGLQRRFLPSLVELAQRAREISDQHDHRAAQLALLVGALSTMSGSGARSSRDSVSLGRFGAPMYATARVIEPLWRKESVVRFSIDAIPEHAMAIAELLGKLHRAPGGADHSPSATQTP